MARRRRFRRSAQRRRFGALKLVFTALIFAGLFALVALLDRQNTSEIAGKVRVVDGDSLILNNEDIRLQGIDAPELLQDCYIEQQAWPCGKMARSALRKKIGREKVSCRFDGRDQYDRLLAICLINDTELNAWLVTAGWAIDYGGYGREEAIARKNQSGIWKGSFENPGEWRRENGSAGFDEGFPRLWKKPDWLPDFGAWFE